MLSVFASFEDLLTQRLETNLLNTEDSLRYTFFAALLKNGIKPHEVVLEFPHPSIKGAHVDTFIPKLSTAFEFKYDRDPPGGKNQPKTQRAGAAFKDLYRQALLAESNYTAYFVYITTAEMAVYFSNPNNGHQKFFNTIQGKSLQIDEAYFQNMPPTFFKTLGEPFRAKLTVSARGDLPRSHLYRIYEVSAYGS